MAHKGALIIRGKRCGAPAPPALVGDLGPLQCGLETNRTGQHDGDHRVNASVYRVGKAKFSWSNKNRPSSQPPVIVLPTTGSTTLNARAPHREDS